MNEMFTSLFSRGLISETTLKNLEKKYASLVVSIYWELKTILYLGVMMLSTGLGILIYKNIDSISHQVVLLCIAGLSAGCFVWCNKRKHPFSYTKVSSPNSYFDYILLLGTLSFLSFLGYLEFQYEAFGTRYGFATFLPMVVLFFIAYYFDHIGILTLGIANLAVWMGITVTPKELLSKGNLNEERIIYTYLLLGFMLLAAGYFTTRRDIKKHFFFSYQHFGVHVTFIALLSCYFFYDYKVSLLFLAAFAGIAWFIYTNALKNRSFYFLLLTVIYSYVALSAFVVRSLDFSQAVSVAYIGFLYFIVSGIGFILFLIDLNKKVKAV